MTDEAKMPDEVWLKKDDRYDNGPLVVTSFADDDPTTTGPYTLTTADKATDAGDTVTITKEAYDFLTGAGPMKGVWFGEKPNENDRQYWWRTCLRPTQPHPPAVAGDICDSDISTIRKSIGSNYLNNKQREEIEDAHMALNRVEAALTPPDNAELVKVRDGLQEILDENEDNMDITENDGPDLAMRTATTAKQIIAILDSMMKREG